MEQEKEIWRPVVGYEGLYEVSNFGRVRSIDRIVPYKNGGVQFKRRKILSQKTDKDGYKHVTLCVNNKLKTYMVHRLVAIAFIPNPLNLPQVNHKDENRTNNYVGNLEWCDAYYNRNYGTCPSKFNTEIICDGVHFASLKECMRYLGIKSTTQIKYAVEHNTKFAQLHNLKYA